MTDRQTRQPAAAPAPTWQDDLSGMSKTDKESAVTRMCSAYGTVVKVTVHVSHAHQSIRAFALVDMSEAEEAERLAVAFNRRRVGTAVLLLLAAQPAA